ncbi:MAG: NAD(P)/FAD-dependent oxidoreductase [Clostridia bacterium]|nr:NAD(P)/FAD-dependent oxidoreductase [Clostridia bacterium]
MKKQPIDIRDSVCIVGGGAAGLMAACIARDAGAKVVLFEKNASEKKIASEQFFDNAYLGKKLLITGKGRCNLTNNCNREDFMKNIPRNGKFMFASFKAFPPEKVMEFFESRGTPLKTERGGRVFPVSDKALDILRCLKETLKGGNCRIINKKIENIVIENEKISKIFDADGNEYITNYVIIATGGLSYPVTGSDGDGYEFAKTAGHTVTELSPSLVPLVSQDQFCKRLQGLSLRNVTLSLKKKANGKAVFSELGEMLFTHFGLSGPLVLSASAHIENDPSEYSVHIDLKPALDEKTLDDRLLSDFSKNQNKDYKNVLGLLLPTKLIPVFAERSGISPDTKVNSITKKQRAEIIALLKNFSVDISGFRPISEAIITRGGVKTSEINPSTMESKKAGGLYFVGEVLDVDGYTGGFNLQIAFSTAYLAAIDAAQKVNEEGYTNV